MDTSWIDLPKGDLAFYNGCMKFIELAKETLIEGKTRCPCNKCRLHKWTTPNELGGHILFYGFYKKYRNWVYHCRDDERSSCTRTTPRVMGGDDMGGLLREAFMVDERFNEPVHESEGSLLMHEPNFEEGPYETNEDFNVHYEVNDEIPSLGTSEEDAKYKRLMEAANEGLYEGCTTFSKLSFLLHLFHLKCMFRWSAESINKLFELLIDAFPQIKEFPSSYYDGKKIIKDLGLGYEKIHACPNNCMLFWGEFADKVECHVCHASRWKTVKGKDGKETIKKGEPTKVARYFPLIPRLKRLYMSSKTAEDMRWHFSRAELVDNKVLTHPADGEAWKAFDKSFPKFAGDPRSVRIGVASDGFNPYRMMNTNHSTWPVVLIPYNLPPWICMKPSSFILSVLIPGKSTPGIHIDIYLQPLFHELKLLWRGVDAFDSYSGETFKLRATIHSTINDFPAYAMLSGWSTKGYKACPSCAESTYSYKFAGKICYPAARKWLPDDHPYRSQAELFDGREEYGRAPIRVSGTDVLKQQEKIKFVYGKPPAKKIGRPEEGTSLNELVNNHGEEDDENVIWKKKSKFFDLEYWKHNLLRHNLDVMHIEKNVCDNFLGTLLGMDNSRDDKKSREALKELNIKSHLWPQSRPNRSDYLPPASYTMSKDEQERFLRVLQKLKVPDGYGSNLQRCVNMKQRKLMGLKSHDNHVLMQDILPVALRASNATKVIDLVEELSDFFKKICATTVVISDLNTIQDKLVLTLCKMEKEFLPSFFTIMVHLLLHLVEEVKLGGPVHYRWMYPIERYLAFLKSQVSNKAQPEGSISEGFLLWETITFCSRYLESVETVFSRPKRNDDGVPTTDNYLYDSGCRVIGKKEKVRLDDRSLRQAHRYVLLHSDEMKPVLDEFIHQKWQENQFGGSRVNENIENQWVINEFADWLLNQVHNIDDSTVEGKLRKALAGGLSDRGKRLKSVIVNGYKFDTMDRERFRKTQKFWNCCRSRWPRVLRKTESDI